jgi:DNA-binding NarL/FixJ family response regulator
LAEAILRHRTHLEGDFNDITDENAEALLADLEALQAQNEAPSEPVQFTHPTATGRRNEITRILTGPEGEGLSDREIARRMGVSNATVSNIRRRLEAQKKAGRKRKR